MGKREGGGAARAESEPPAAAMVRNPMPRRAGALGGDQDGRGH